MTAPYVYTPVERASRRLGVFILILLGLGLTTLLFFVKSQAQDARAHVAHLESEIERYEAAIRVLTAEQAVLSNAERLRPLAQDRLGLEPIKVSETTTVDTLEAQP